MRKAYFAVFILISYRVRQCIAVLKIVILATRRVQGILDAWPWPTEQRTESSILNRGDSKPNGNNPCDISRYKAVKMAFDINA